MALTRIVTAETGHPGRSWNIGASAPFDSQEGRIMTADPTPIADARLPAADPNPGRDFEAEPVPYDVSNEEPEEPSDDE